VTHEARRFQPMRLCFIHQNLPAQYRHLDTALLQRRSELA
jgi:hypothetical protein